MKEQEKKFFICEHCGNLVGLIHSSGAPLVCCGDEMTELIPNTVDASSEKHVPVIRLEGNKVTVTVGSALHPMTQEHYISWIFIQTEKGGQRKELLPGNDPSVEFALTDDDKLVSAYAYCNLHGLWKSNL